MLPYPPSSPLQTQPTPRLHAPTLTSNPPHSFYTYALVSTLISHICVWLQLLDSAGVGGSDTAAAAAALREKNEISVMGLIGTGTFGKVWESVGNVGDVWQGVGKCGECGGRLARCSESGGDVGEKVRERVWWRGESGTDIYQMKTNQIKRMC